MRKMITWKVFSLLLVLADTLRIRRSESDILNTIPGVEVETNEEKESTTSNPYTYSITSNIISDLPFTPTPAYYGPSPYSPTPTSLYGSAYPTIPTHYKHPTTKIPVKSLPFLNPYLATLATPSPAPHYYPRTQYQYPVPHNPPALTFLDQEPGNQAIIVKHYSYTPQPRLTPLQPASQGNTTVTGDTNEDATEDKEDIKMNKEEAVDSVTNELTLQFPQILLETNNSVTKSGEKELQLTTSDIPEEETVDKDVKTDQAEEDSEVNNLELEIFSDPSILLPSSADVPRSAQTDQPLLNTDEAASNPLNFIPVSIQENFRVVKTKEDSRGGRLLPEPVFMPDLRNIRPTAQHLLRQPQDYLFHPEPTQASQSSPFIQQFQPQQPAPKTTPDFKNSEQVPVFEVTSFLETQPAVTSQPLTFQTEFNIDSPSAFSQQFEPNQPAALTQFNTDSLDALPPSQDQREHKSFSLPPADPRLNEISAGPGETLLQSITKEAVDRPVRKKAEQRGAAKSGAKSSALEALVRIAGPDWDTTLHTGKTILSTTTTTFTCPTMAGNYPHQEDCATYYQCAEGVAHTHTCQQGLLWNMATNTCDWAQSVDCEVNRGNKEVSTPAQGNQVQPSPFTMFTV